MRLLLAVLAGSLLLSGQAKVIVAKGGAPPVGPYSPGLDAGNYVYVSGQGVRDSKSQMPQGIAAQTKQCIENVRVILDAAGLALTDTVAVQLYVDDAKNLPAVQAAYIEAFPHNPARITLVVAKMPTDTTVEITVVALKKGAKADRVYLPAVYGETMREAQANLKKELKKAGLSEKNVLFANRYNVGSAEAGVVPMHELPAGAKNAIFAVAAKKKPANLAFCEVAASEPSGTIEEQTKTVFAKLKSCLEKQGMSLGDAVATNVYVDDLTDFGKMNAVYATFFPGTKPTRTTVQPLPSSHKGSLARISAVAAK